MAAPSVRAAAHEPLARRLLRLLRVPARDERVPVVQPLRPAVVAALGRYRELPLPAHRRSAGVDGGEEHAVADRGDRSAPGRLRVRDRDAARAREDRRWHLEDDLLPTGARSACRGDARFRLHPQSGDGAGEHDPLPSRDRRTAVVPGSRVVEAVADPARHLGSREHDGDLPRGRARRSAASLRVGGARRRGPVAAPPLGDAADNRAP